MMRIYKIIFLLFFLGCSKPETYLIPKGFIGRVTVVFNQRNGTPPRYENGRRLYIIPANGICLTQIKPEYGIINHKYYYFSGSTREEIPVYTHSYNKDGTVKWLIADSNKVGIFGDGTTGQYDWDDKAPFQFFFVSSFNQLDTIEPSDKFDKRINKILGTNL